MTAEEMREAVSFAGRTMVRREPVGVAAVVASWSYRLMLAFCELAPALAAGCTIVLKPAAETSLSAYILAEAFEAADFPPGVFNLVTGTSEVAEMLAAHPGVDIVAVAGPTQAGRRMAAICGETLKPVSLELGGKSAAIVNDSRDGLAGSVWTDDPERGLEVARRARVGTFGVNFYVPDIGAPWGWRKACGMGSVYGPEGLQTYLASKCVFLPVG